VKDVGGGVWFGGAWDKIDGLCVLLGWEAFGACWNLDTMVLRHQTTPI
jgi:hypothetical protein